MSDFLDTTSELAGVVSEVRDAEGQLTNDLKKLDISRQNEAEMKKSTEEMQESMRTALRKSDELHNGLRSANNSQEEKLERNKRELRERLQNTFNDLERSRAVAKAQRQAEDGAFGDLEEDLLRALGSDGERGREEAKRIVQTEFPDDNDDSD